MRDPLDILKEVWGFDEFRTPQEQIIRDVLDGKDAFALLPTGGGKSLCYQVPAVTLDGLTLVISPLIALMEDQVNQLKSKGVNAAAITSSLNQKQIDILLDNAVHGAYKLLYISPERINTEMFRMRFERMNIQLIAVDEAHCVSQWGFDFRPSYLNIASIRSKLPGVPLLALTATATPEVVEQIHANLELDHATTHRMPFVRDNLSYLVKQSEDPYFDLIRLCERAQGSGIVYCRSRKATVYLSQRLQQQGVSSSFYHAGLDPELRKKRQSEWTSGDTRVICATNAFGMGIDKPDVRFVFHWDLPENIESYFQEAGRAGRDGKPSAALIVTSKDKEEKLKEQLEINYPEVDLVKRVYRAIGNFYQLATGSGKDEVFELDIERFAERYKLAIKTTYAALKILMLEGYLVFDESSWKPSTVEMIRDHREIYNFKVGNKVLQPLIDCLLRNYPGIFEEPKRISLRTMAFQLKSDEKTIERWMHKLHQLELINYIPRSNHPRLTLTREMLSDKQFKLSAETYLFLKNRAIKRLDDILDFLGDIRCRSVFLAEYFGDKDPDDCGKCDRCLDRKRRANPPSPTQLQRKGQQLLDALENRSMMAKELLASVDWNEKDFAEVLTFLEDQGKIRIGLDTLIERTS